MFIQEHINFREEKIVGKKILLYSEKFILSNLVIAHSCSSFLNTGSFIQPQGSIHTLFVVNNNRSCLSSFLAFISHVFVSYSSEKRFPHNLPLYLYTFNIKLAFIHSTQNAMNIEYWIYKEERESWNEITTLFVFSYINIHINKCSYDCSLKTRFVRSLIAHSWHSLVPPTPRKIHPFLLCFLRSYDVDGI